MAELVDASVSNTDAARRAGSTPAPGTSNETLSKMRGFRCFLIEYILLKIAVCFTIFE